ncbi:MAG: hypothetical protein K6E17_07275 [Clostridiales bacterium]|nr:hypothetical protein [Clostridiales bacterium]
MKAAAIILIILVVLALGAVGFLYATSTLTVSYVDCAAEDPLVQSAYFDQLKNSLANETFIGTRFTKDDLSTADNYVFYTWTVRLTNETFLDAEVAEIQITPMTGDVLQIGDTRQHTIKAKSDGTISATILTNRSMHSVREAIVTWYFWGLPFSARVTLGR